MYCCSSVSCEVGTVRSGSFGHLASICRDQDVPVRPARFVPDPVACHRQYGGLDAPEYAFGSGPEQPFSDARAPVTIHGDEVDIVIGDVFGDDRPWGSLDQVGLYRRRSIDI